MPLGAQAHGDAPADERGEAQDQPGRGLARSDRPMSWELLRGALNADITDIQGGTTPEGIHLGAMAGTVDLVQRCLTGIETRGNILHFDPVLPQRLDVEVTQDVLRVRSHQCTAAPIAIAYRGHYRQVAPGDAYQFRLVKHGRRRREISRESQERLEQPEGE